MEYSRTPPPYHPPNAEEALSRIRVDYRKEPDTFTVTTLVHGALKRIVTIVESIERESRAGGGFDKETLVLLVQIKDTCRKSAQHLSDLMWPETSLLSQDQQRKLKLGDPGPTEVLAYAYDDLMHNVSLPLSLYKDYKMDCMKPDLKFLLNRCAILYTSTKIATVALRYRVLDKLKLCPVAENLLRILDPATSESGDNYTKFRAEMPKWGRYVERKHGLAWDCDFCVSPVRWSKIRKIPAGSGVAGHPIWLGNGCLEPKKWRIMDVWAIAGHCPRDDAYPDQCPIVCLICYSGEARNCSPRELFTGTDDLLDHMMQQHWKDAPDIEKDSGCCAAM